MPDYIEAGRVGVVFEGDIRDLQRKETEFHQILGRIKGKSAPVVKLRVQAPNATEIKKAFGTVVVPVGVNITTKSLNEAIKTATTRSTFNANVNVTPVVSATSLRALSAQIQAHLDTQKFNINVGAAAGPAIGANQARILDIPLPARRDIGGAMFRPGNPLSGYLAPDTGGGSAGPRRTPSPPPGVSPSASSASPYVVPVPAGVNPRTGQPQYRSSAGQWVSQSQMNDMYRNRVNETSYMNRRALGASFGGGTDAGRNVGPLGNMRNRLYDPAGRVDHAMSQLQSHFNGKIIPTVSGIGPRLSTMMTQGVDRMMAQGRRNLFAGLTLSMAFTRPAIQAGRAAIGMTTDYERRMRVLPAQTDIKEGDLRMLGRGGLRVGRDTGRNYKEITDAMRVIASTGNNATDTLKILQATAIGAAGGMGETAQVAKTVSTALQVYGEDADQATRYTDVLAMAVKDGRDEAENFAPAIGKVIGMAKIAGVSFEEVAANIATFTRAGVTANQAGTGLNMMLKNLVAPTKRAKAVMEEMGMSSADMRKMIDEKGLFATLQKIFKDTGGNIETVNALVGSVTGLRNALSTAGAQADDYRQILNNAFNATGQSQRSFDEMGKTLDVQWARLKEAVASTIIEITQRHLPQLTKKIKEFADDAPGFFDSVSAHWNELPDSIKNLVKGLGAFLVLGGPLLIMKSVLIDVAAAGLAMTAAFVGSPILVGGAALAGIASMTGHVDTLKESVLALTAAFVAMAAIRVGPSVLAAMNLIGPAARGIGAVAGQTASVAGGVLAGGMTRAQLTRLAVGRNAAERVGTASAWGPGVRSAGASAAFGGTAAVAGAIASGVGAAAIGGAVGVGATAYQNYLRNASEVQSANVALKGSLMDVADAFESLRVASITPDAVGGKARKGESASELLASLEQDFAAAEESGEKMDAVGRRIARTISDIQRGKIKLDIDAGSTVLFVDSLRELEAQTRLTMTSVHDDINTARDALYRKETETSWLDDFGRTLRESDPYGLVTFNDLLGRIDQSYKNIAKSAVDWIAGGIVPTTALPPGMGLEGSGKWVPPGPVAATPVPRRAGGNSYGPRTPRESLRAGEITAAQFIETEKPDKARLQLLYEEYSRIVARGNATRMQKANMETFKAKLAAASKATAGVPAGGGIDMDAARAREKAEDEAQRRREAEQIKSLQEIQKAWQSYTSAIEGTLGRIRAFGEETEEARMRNEMLKVSLGAVSEAYIKQAIAVGKLYDQMQRLTGMRDSMRSVFEGFQSKLVGMGILQDPNQSSLSRLQNVFQYGDRMARKGNRALRTGGSALDYAQGQIASLETQQMDVRYDNSIAASSDTGMKIALNAEAKQARKIAQRYKGQCDKLADTTVRDVTSAYNSIMGPMGEDDTAARTMNRFKRAGIGMPYQKGMALAPGGLLYTGRGGGGAGHVVTVGTQGQLLDQYGSNKFRRDYFEWYVPPPGAATNAPAPAAGPAPKGSTTNKKAALSRVYGGVKASDYDSSLGFMSQAPDWLRKAWGRPVSERDAFAEQRMAGQSMVFSREGLKNINKYAQDAGLEAAIQLVRAFRDGVSKQDITLRSIAMGNMRRDALKGYRRDSFMMRQDYNQYGELDYAFRSGEIDLPTYNLRAHIQSKLTSQAGWKNLRSELRSGRTGRSAIQSGLDALGTGSAYNPDAADRAKARREYEMNLWRDPESVVVKEFTDKHKNEKLRKAEANRMARKLMGNWDQNWDAAQAEGVEKAFQAQLNALGQQNEQVRLNLRLRREGRLTEEEISDELAVQEAYAKALLDYKGDKSAANDIAGNLRGILKFQRRANRIAREGEYDFQNFDARRVASENRSLAYAFDPSDPNYYRDQRRIELRSEARRKARTEPDFDALGYISEGMETFEIEAKAQAADDMSRTLHSLRMEMQSFADDTGLAAYALEQLNSKAVAFGEDPSEAIRNRVGIYNRSALYGIARETALYRHRNEGDRADALAQMRISGMHPSLAGTGFESGQLAIAAATRKRESSNAGFDMITAGRERIRQDQIALQLAAATTAEERRRIELQAELNELKARGITLSRNDLALVKTMHEKSIMDTRLAKEQNQYKDFGTRVRDDLVSTFAEAGTDIKKMLGSIGQSIQNLILGKLRERAADAIVERILPGWKAEESAPIFPGRPRKGNMSAAGMADVLGYRGGMSVDGMAAALGVIPEMIGGFAGGSPVADLMGQLGAPFMPAAATTPTAPTVPGGIASMVAQNVSIQAMQAQMSAQVVYLQASSVVGGGAGGGVSAGALGALAGLGASMGSREGGMSNAQILDGLGATELAIG